MDYGLELPPRQRMGERPEPGRRRRREWGRQAPRRASRAGARVDLPHDWAIELPFDPTADGSHGFRAVGEAFPQNSVAWYRRSFDLPAADAGRRLWLEFDGVYRDSTVFVNGWFVAHHESGYSGFRCDITDVANCGGRNVVAVRVDATQPEGWFYEGAGIYRHVWLVKTAPLAVAPDGVFVYSRFKDNVPAGPDEVHMEARLLNSPATCPRTLPSPGRSWRRGAPRSRPRPAPGGWRPGGSLDLGQDGEARGARCSGRPRRRCSTRSSRPLRAAARRSTASRPPSASARSASTPTGASC